MVPITRKLLQELNVFPNQVYVFTRKRKNFLVYLVVWVSQLFLLKGVMSDKQARKEGLGGEVIAYVW